MLLSFCWFTPVLAQDYDQVKSQAVSAYRAGNYEEAARLYIQAFAIEPRGNLLYNIAISYEKAGNIQQAVAYYERFNDAVPDSPQRDVAVRKISDLKPQLQANMVDVTVGSTPYGATIFVDDRAKGALGTAPLTFGLLPGRYTIIADLKGYQQASREIQVVKGKPLRVDLSLANLNDLGKMRISVSEDEASIVVDGKKLAVSPYVKTLQVPVGWREILVVKPGYEVWRQTVEIKPQGETRVVAELAIEGSGGETSLESALASDVEPSLAEAISESYDASKYNSKGPGFWPWLVVGVGGAAVAGGAVTGVLGQGLYDQLNEKRKKRELIATSDIDAGNTYVLMTNVLLGVGSAAIVGGLIWWWFTRPTEETLGEFRNNSKEVHFVAMPAMSVEGEPMLSLFGRF